MKLILIFFFFFEKTLKLVSISKIAKPESRSLQLVCVSTKGDRFYFSTCYNDSPDSVTLRFIKRAHQLKSHSKMSLSSTTVFKKRNKKYLLIFQF